MVAQICKIYGWTYEEYMAQPKWFLDTVREIEKVDRTKQKHAKAQPKQRRH